MQIRRFRSSIFRKPNLMKGAVAGLAGGLIASWTMSQYQHLWTKVDQELREKKGEPPPERRPAAEDPTVKTAEVVSEELLDRPLRKKEQRPAGIAVHYAFGSLIGAAFGAVSEFIPKVSQGAGVPFGASVWVGADEIALPALRLSKGPAAYPVSNHVYALSSHLVYGFVADSVRRLVRKWW